MKSFVACCSINFLAKFFFLASVLYPGEEGCFENDLFGLKGFFFSTEKVFLPRAEIDEVSIFFF